MEEIRKEEERGGRGGGKVKRELINVGRGKGGRRELCNTLTPSTSHYSAGRRSTNYVIIKLSSSLLFPLRESKIK